MHELDQLPQQGELKIGYPSTTDPIFQEYNSLNLLKRKANALKRHVVKE